MSNIKNNSTSSSNHSLEFESELDLNNFTSKLQQVQRSITPKFMNHVSAQNSKAKTIFSANSLGTSPELKTRAAIPIDFLKLDSKKFKNTLDENLLNFHLDKNHNLKKEEKDDSSPQGNFNNYFDFQKFMKGKIESEKLLRKKRKIPVIKSKQGTLVNNCSIDEFEIEMQEICGIFDDNEEEEFKIDEPISKARMGNLFGERKSRKSKTDICYGRLGGEFS